MQNRANVIGWISILLNAGAQLILAPIIKSKMGTTGLGVWHIVFQTFVYLQLIDFGWSNSIVKEVASVRWDQKGRSHERLIMTALFFLSVIGLIFFTTGIGAAVLVPRLITVPKPFQSDFTLSVSLFAAWGIFRYRYALPFLMLKGRNRLVEFNSLEIIQSAGRPLLGALFALANMGIAGIVAGYATAEATARLIAWRLCPIEKFRASPHLKIFNRMIKFGSTTGLISLSSMITFYSSSFIVGWKMNITQVAVYQSTMALPLLLMKLATIPFSNRLPIMIYDYQQNIDSNKIRSHMIILGLSGLFLFGICIANELFVTLWVGKELFAGLSFSLVFSLFLLLSIARHNGFMVWQSKGRLNAMMITHLIEVPIGIGLSLVLIDAMGLIGVAWAFVFASLPSVVVSQFSFFEKVVNPRP